MTNEKHDDYKITSLQETGSCIIFGDDTLADMLRVLDTLGVTPDNAYINLRGRLAIKQ